MKKTNVHRNRLCAIWQITKCVWIFAEESLQKYSHKTSQNNSFYTVQICFLKLAESSRLFSY